MLPIKGTMWKTSGGREGSRGRRICAAMLRRMAAAMKRGMETPIRKVYECWDVYVARGARVASRRPMVRVEEVDVVVRSRGRGETVGNVASMGWR